MSRTSLSTANLLWHHFRFKGVSSATTFEPYLSHMATGHTHTRTHARTHRQTHTPLSTSNCKRSAVKASFHNVNSTEVQGSCMITAAHKRLCPCDTSANLSRKIVPPKGSVNLPISQSTLQVGNLFLACISHTSLKSLSTRYDVCRRPRILGRCMCSGSPAFDHLPSLQEIRSVKDKPFYCHSSVESLPFQGRVFLLLPFSKQNPSLQQLLSHI